MDEKVLMAALAGLLHDIGKFAQRAGEKPGQDFDKADVGSHGYHALLSNDFVNAYVPEHLRNGLSGVLYHHRYDLHDPEIETIRRADHLAAGERRTGSDEHADPKNARLIPVLSNVSLLAAAPGGWKHQLSALNVNDNKSVYPTKGDETGNYAALWKGMTDELKEWQHKSGKEWDIQSGEDYFITLSAVLYKYLWCIPSATPWQESEKDKAYRAWPDVSLYDHDRLTSAIAACLAYDQNLPEEKSTQPVAFLARGDFSGIQNFIYRISRPESETEHIAKRLRGRSFYIQLLTEVVVDWILREIGLPSSCAIFVGGGRFDLLLPLTAHEKLSQLQIQLEEWLLAQFQGEISVLIAAEQARSDDFNDTRDISGKLDMQLEGLKRRKWQSQLAKADFYEPAGAQWHVCKICQLTPRDESDICPQCSQHENIGRYLPYARYLALCYGGSLSLPEDQVIKFPGDRFGVQIAIVRDEADLKKLLGTKGRFVLYSVNETNDFIQPGVASSFRFLANSAPQALEKFKAGVEMAVDEGAILHFEAIAALSKGAKRLGVLKADVDRLGLVMSEGLSEEKNSKNKDMILRPTLSRVASLSRMMDVFFAGCLNRICRDVFDDWEHADKHRVDGLFYIMYSGGDDLFIVGPWDQILILAARINSEFQEFTGTNPSMTLSAGYVQVKPRYPVQKFAELVDVAESQAKQAGRNRFSAFGETMIWTEYKWLHNEAGRWIAGVGEKKLTSGLIYDLGGLFRQHKQKDGKLRPMWSPRLYYTLARRLKADVRKEFEEDIFKVIASGKTLVPVSIASLSIRERS